MVVFRAEVTVRAVLNPKAINGGLNGLQLRFSEGAASLPYHFAQRVEAYAKASSPVRTGKLKGSIKRERLGPNSHKVTVSAFYGIYVNYGTRYMRAQPFWEPAIEKALIDLREEMKRMLHG